MIAFFLTMPTSRMTPISAIRSLTGNRRVSAASLRGEAIDRGRVVLEVNSTFSALAAASSGLGIATLLPEIAEGDPRLVRLWPDREQAFEVWLVVHSDVYKAARVRTVMDAIIAAFDKQDRVAAE